VIKMYCSHCDKALEIDDKYAGQEGKCSHCQGIIFVPKPPVKAKGYGFFRRHKILTSFLILILIGLLGFWSRLRGPHHGYELDFINAPKISEAPSSSFQVGVAMRNISPDFSTFDTWVDVNENSKYDEGIDTYEDTNGNGKFDAIWMAGFSSNRPAKGINDTPWTRVIAMRNNGITIVLVTIDSVGIFSNDFISVRKSVDPSLGIDHIMFSSSHTHETPDTMKIWSGPNPIFGYREEYMDMIRAQTKDAIEEAVSKLEDADMYCATAQVPIEGFINDSRKPEVINQSMYLMRFTKPNSEETIATFANWGNHPEALGAKNGMITSDFPHWLREGMEFGVRDPNGLKGFGGMCLYFQGEIGGLMTQLHTTVPHRDGIQMFKKASFAKAQALGENLAIIAVNTLRGDSVWKNENPRLAVAARTITIPMEGMYKYAMMLGLIHEGYILGKGAQTELNVIRIGEVLLLSIPGEIYPEIVEGGIEAKEARDFPIAPVEVPPLRDAMEAKARMAMVIGLANDQIGYIIPKSQWDVEAPFVYNGKDQYGEENSAGPEVGPIIHRESMQMLNEMNETFEQPSSQ